MWEAASSLSEDIADFAFPPKERGRIDDATKAQRMRKFDELMKLWYSSKHFFYYTHYVLIRTNCSRRLKLPQFGSRPNFSSKVDRRVSSNQFARFSWHL